MVKWDEWEENLGLAICTREGESESPYNNIWRGGQLLVLERG
jgi:hypothetical protein